MHIRYTSRDYLDKIELIRKYMPDCAVSTDLMIGFPTETEDDFLDTIRVFEQAKFSSAFTFVYSRRKGTVADRMDGQVSDDVKKDRIMRLVAFANDKTREISEEYVGKTIQILCEDYDPKKGMYLGRDEYGRMGYFRSDKNLTGEFVDINITSANGISLYGEMVE